MAKIRSFSPVPTLFGGFELPAVRTYRIPYVGSKNAIASELIGAMLSRVDGHGGRRFVDAFCGGGAILYGVWQTRMFQSVLGNDLHSGMIALHRDLPRLDLEYVANTPCLLLPNALVQEKYPFVKMIGEIAPEYEMAFRITYSFGNDCRTNLWGGDMVVKYGLSRMLLSSPDLVGAEVSRFIGSDVVIPFDYKTTGFSSRYGEYKRHIGLYRGDLRQLDRLEQLERLQQLEQLQQLERLQQLEQLQQLQQLQQLEQLQQLQQLQHRIDFTSVGYDGIDYGPGDVVYFDPPYRSTLDYHGTGFDNDAFEDFARSLKVPVFISEYSPAIKGFQPILKLGKRSTMNNKGDCKENQQRWEYLHWNGIR